MPKSNKQPDNIPTESYFERYRKLKLEGKESTNKPVNSAKGNANRINNYSAKREKQNAEYSKLAKQFKIDNPYCKARLEGCGLHTKHVHHQKGRIGVLLTDLRYFLPVCEHCHHIIETQPKRALELNLSLLRLKKDL